MDVYEAVSLRKSVREFQQRDVPQPILTRLLEAARLAPSASNRQPWSFIVVRDQAVLQQVAQHAAYYFIRWAHVKEAPMVIALCGKAKGPIYPQFLGEDIGLAGGTPSHAIYVDGQPDRKFKNDNLVEDLERLIREKAAAKAEQEANIIAKETTE